jgi:signal transduction histidine kinase
MARLDTAQITIQPKPGDLVTAVQEVIASVAGKVEDRGVEIACPPDFPPVAFDPDLVKLAVKELLDNALKYSSPGTAVTIRLEESDGLATLDITDFGKGIPVPEQNRIFERFYRSPSVHRLVPGTGLGLSIAHRIAKAHNGDLTVLSRPGSTTFRMTLPLVSSGAGN